MLIRCSVPKRSPVRNHGGQRLPGLDGAVDDLDAVDAEIAVAARLDPLAEIRKKSLAAAARRLAQRDQRN